MDVKKPAAQECLKMRQSVQLFSKVFFFETHECQFQSSLQIHLKIGKTNAKNSV